MEKVSPPGRIGDKMTNETDTIANSALLKATEALIRISAHELECARRYAEGRDQNSHQHAENVSKMGRLEDKVDTLLSQNERAKGRLETNRALFAGIPNAFWQLVMQMLSGGIVAVIVLLAMKGKIP